MNLFIEASDWKISSQSCKCLIIEGMFYKLLRLVLFTPRVRFAQEIILQNYQVVPFPDGSQVRCWHTTWSSKVWPHLSVSQDLEVVYDPQEKRCTKIKELKNE